MVERGISTLTPSKHELNRAHTRASLEAAAWRHFLSDGYEKTTVSSIAESAGVSERTFFRHFDSKEAVLFGDWRSQLEILSRDIIEASPDLEPLSVVRAAVVALVRRYDDQGDRNAIRVRLMDESESVSTYERRVIHREWEDAIAAAVAHRLGITPDSDLRPHLIAGVAVAAVHSALIVWQQQSEYPIVHFVADAFDQLSTTGDA
jgi:AcrR family transcriptional regulator